MLHAGRASVIACSFCGAANEPAARFCIDCGKPITASAVRPAPVMMAAGGVPAPGLGLASGNGGYAAPTAKKCPRCSRMSDASLPFCGHCGARLGGDPRSGQCHSCGVEYQEGVDVFCARCGTRVGQRVSINVRSHPETAVNVERTALGPRLSLIGDSGNVTKTFTLDRGEAEIGRIEADIVFSEDHFLSPIHARLELRDGTL